MRKPVRWAFAAAMAAGMVGISVAQERQRQGGGFFGGGLGGPTALLQSKTVREDLKVTEEQGKKLLEWVKEYREKSRASLQEAQEKLKDLPREEAGPKMAALFAERTAATYKELGTILDEKQVQRLKQIDLQVAGTQALSRPDVQEALKVTDEQKEKLRGVGRDSFAAMRELREEYGIQGFGPPRLDEAKQKEYDRKLAGIRKEVEDETLAALTDDQKARWKEMTGAPIDVAKVREETRGQFGGGQGRPGGGRPDQKKKDN